MPWAFFIYHPLYFKFQSCYQQCKTRVKKVCIGFLFSIIFTGFVVKVCQLDVLSKKLPSHDRLTTNEGFEPTHATRI
ncbi:hypothetical protein PQF02_gp47 [Streptococcus phage P7952]|uniref:Uncharacterized protein n=3 Tax=Brussowvirus TaxID=1623303 RepID=A0A286QRT0_9CAUD|nr:hypothetical protein PQF02_gp47 [Streptococcus phage P7952]YP_010683166.1 hypothetical protein PQF03_gp42 [Streptococcus phage P7953]YP_010683262.1 hypothetical protein PQF05_gp49 [Streptococcus phage P7955]ARU14279.1 hypothetical protein P7952_47 [Streptococcus phage P7952]ARU14322.1 hypothetical protein P7953_42 [Streptococcus phage P7953]ARU14418.1 hypothetical protein P7955_49 [Streptococcus phage P7955]